VQLCLSLPDAVEKLSNEQRAGNNRIQVPRSLNQCCAPVSYLESMLLTRALKSVFRQHRSSAAVSKRDHVVGKVVESRLKERLAYWEEI
jgi:hypothetical protein